MLLWYKVSPLSAFYIFVFKQGGLLYAFLYSFVPMNLH